VHATKKSPINKPLLPKNSLHLCIIKVDKKRDMIDKLKIAGKYILSQFSKLQLAIIVALIVSAFIISDSNIFTRWGYDMEIRDLKNQIEYYKEKTVEDQRKLKELRSDKENIEKFARENYKMKRENEEVFIIE
jgi:cell division protein FtsB